MRKALFLFLFLLPFASAEAQTVVDRYVNTDCANNGDGTARTCAASPGAAGAYTTLANAQSDIATDYSSNLVTANVQVNIHCSGAAADTSAFDTGAGWTTDATRFVVIRCDAGDPEGCGWSGAWSTSHYRLSSAGGDGAFRLNVIGYARVIGLQIESTAGGTNSARCITISNAPAAPREFRIIGNHCRYRPSGAPTTSVNNHGISAPGNSIIVNNFVEGYTRSGISASTASSGQYLAIANNTITNNAERGILINAAGTTDTVRVRNNILSGTGNDYELTSTADTYETGANITADATSPDVAFRNLTPSYVNSGAADYRLTTGDTVAREQGIDLSGWVGFAFTGDINGDTRPLNTSWDIGADEVAGAVPTPTPTPTPTPVYTNAGLFWTDGVEPGDPSVCEAPSGKTCYWVDCDATSDGTGTYASPYHGFETVFGYYIGSNYQLGIARGGDIVYVKGTCEVTGSVDDVNGPYKQIRLARGVQYGTSTEPLIIKSYRGTAAALFDGEFASTLTPQNSTDNSPANLMRFWDTNSTGGAVRLQNIKFTRWFNKGASTSGDVGILDVYSVEGYNGRMDQNDGVSGVIAFSVSTAQVTDHVIRNSIFRDTTNNCGTGGDSDCTLANNDGTIAILSTTTAAGAKVTIRDSLFQNNTRHIRDKHNGQLAVYVFGNVFTGGEQAFHRRQQDYYIYNNIFSGLTGRLIDTETAAATNPVNTRFYNNSLYNIATLIGSSSTWSDDGVFEIYNNAFDSNVSTAVPFINLGGGGNVDPADFIQDRNYFRVNSTQQATFSCLGPTPPGTGACTNRNFATHNTYVSDTTSATTNPNFSAPASGNFYIASGDPACTAGRSGSYIGALACLSAGSGGSNSTGRTLFPLWNRRSR